MKKHDELIVYYQGNGWSAFSQYPRLKKIGQYPKSQSLSTEENQQIRARNGVRI